jgi:hypothetical protein
MKKESVSETTSTKGDRPMTKVKPAPWREENFTPEFKWDQPEPFALVVETATDGDRITADRQATDQAKTENEKKQTMMI